MLRVFVLVVVISVSIPLYADTPMVGKNLLPNESFENRPGFKDETPREWGSWGSDSNGLSTTIHRKGQQSVYFVCPKQNASMGIFYTYRNVKPGNTYTFSGYILNCAEDPIRGNAFGQLSIEWRKIMDNGREEIGRDYGPKFGSELSPMKWTFVTMSAVAPVDTDDCNFVIQFFNKGDGGGKFFADDVSAKGINEGTAVKGFLLLKSRPDTKTGAHR